MNINQTVDGLLLQYEKERGLYRRVFEILRLFDYEECVLSWGYVPYVDFLKEEPLSDTDITGLVMSVDAYTKCYEVAYEVKESYSALVSGSYTPEQESEVRSAFLKAYGEDLQEHLEPAHTVAMATCPTWAKLALIYELSNGTGYKML